MNGILNLCGKLINLSFKRKTSFSCQIYFLFGIKIDIFNDNCYFYQLNKVQCAPHLSVSFNKSFFTQFNVMIFPLPHHLKKYVSTSPPSIAPLHLFLLFSWSNIGLFLFPDLHTFNQHIRFTPNLKIYLMNPLPIKISIPILSPLVTAKMQERESCAPKLAVPLFYFLLFLKPFYNVYETIDCRLPA